MQHPLTPRFSAIDRELARIAQKEKQQPWNHLTDAPENLHTSTGFLPSVERFVGHEK